MMLTLRLLHVMVAAAWFGHKLLVPSDLRRSLTDIPEANSLLRRMDVAERLGIASGFGTLLTGAALVFAIGPRVVPWPVYVGLGLVVAAIAVGAIVGRPSSIELRRAIGLDSLEAARRAARTLVVVLNIEAVLWSATLVTMLI